MVDPQTSRFWRVAVQSGLMDVASLQACWDLLPPEKRTPDAIDRRLARQAVNANLITVWQAQQLMTGRASGFKIDRYVLVDLLGQGGMGRVYLAKDSRLGRQVAIKVLSTSRMNNPRAIARFQREGKVGAQLQHENLVRIYDEGESGNIRYLVMEFIEGKNIAQLIGEQGAIAWAAAVRLVRQVALGLEHAHQKGLIHRDVNPSNILVTREGTAKLTDLGLAIDLADEGNVTRDGATVGTFDYISPEQAKHSREVDTRADIYSLGCTLYHMIAGRVPFPVPSLPEKLYAHQLHDADPLFTLVNDVPEGLSRVVAKMMAKKPEDRYATPHAVAVALEPYVDEAARLKPSALLMTRSVSGEYLVDAPKTRVVAPVKLDAMEGKPAPAGTTPPNAAPADNLGDFPKTTAAAASNGLVSDPDLAIFSVDTGPDEPLTAALQSSSRPKAKPRVTKSKTGDSAETVAVANPKYRRWIPIAAGISGVIVLGGILAIVFSATSKKPNEVATTITTTSDLKKKTERNDFSSTKASRPGSSRSPTISVHSRGGTRIVEKLEEAVQIASGNGGEIIINASTPVRLASADAFKILRGNVLIRAEEGTSPIIAVEVSNTTPLITILPQASVTLRGLSILVHYQPIDKPIPLPPLPLIRSSGTLRLENCSFVANGASTGRTRAIHHEGLKLDINGCLFSGFNRAIDFEAYPESHLSMSQSMLIRTGENTGSPTWGIKVQFATSRTDKAGQTLRRIDIDHVTANGGGLLEMVGFSPSYPIAVKLTRNAIQTRALVAWTPAKADREENWSKSLKWTGTANRYDITGGTWVLISAESELPWSGAPADLKAWSEVLNTDKDSVSQSFRFATNPTTMLSQGTIDPTAFGLEGEGIANTGADPKQIGPGQKANAPDRTEKPAETKKAAETPKASETEKPAEANSTDMKKTEEAPKSTKPAEAKTKKAAATKKDEMKKKTDDSSKTKTQPKTEKTATPDA